MVMGEEQIMLKRLPNHTYSESIFHAGFNGGLISIQFQIVKKLCRLKDEFNS
jgi:hypothetical protein